MGGLFGKPLDKDSEVSSVGKPDSEIAVGKPIDEVETLKYALEKDRKFLLRIYEYDAYTGKHALALLDELARIVRSAESADRDVRSGELMKMQNGYLNILIALTKVEEVLKNHSDLPLGPRATKYLLGSDYVDEVYGNNTGKNPNDNVDLSPAKNMITKSKTAADALRPIIDKISDTILRIQKYVKNKLQKSKSDYGDPSKDIDERWRMQHIPGYKPRVDPEWEKKAEEEYRKNKKQNTQDDIDKRMGEYEEKLDSDVRETYKKYLEEKKEEDQQIIQKKVEEYRKEAARIEQEVDKKLRELIDKRTEMSKAERKKIEEEVAELRKKEEEASKNESRAKEEIKEMRKEYNRYMKEEKTMRNSLEMGQREVYDKEWKNFHQTWVEIHGEGDFMGELKQWIKTWPKLWAKYDKKSATTVAPHCTCKACGGLIVTYTRY